MKVCLINTNNTGSTGTICNLICEYLIEQGDEALFLCKERGSLKAFCHSCYSGVIDDLINKIITRINGKDGFLNKRNTEAVLNALSAFKPDIVNIHNIHSNFLNVFKIIDFCNKNRIKIVWTLHDCWPFTGRCAHYDYNGCYKWKTNCRKCAFKTEYPSTLIFDFSKNLFNVKKDSFTKKDITFVVPSMWLKEQINESFLRNEKVVVISNGFRKPFNISEEKIKDKKRQIGVEDFEKIVFSAAYPWSKAKGIQYVEKLSMILKNQGIAFIIAGLTKNKKTNSNVFYIPRITNKEDMNTMYSLSDVFFNPTLQDTFPSVIIESLFCGTPVVTFETGGCPEIINEDTGFVVKKGDVIAAAEAILSMHKDSITIEKCKKRALLFTDKLMVQNYYALFSEILNN